MDTGGRILNSRHFFSICLILTGGFAICPDVTRAQGNDAPRPTRVISLPSAENVKELYVAIMGEVSKPGTYHVDPSSLKLQAVVRSAGGLTSNASPTIRVVRHGRVTQKEVYSEEANTPLFPGDLLIVDSKPSAMKNSKQRTLGDQPVAVPVNFEARSSGHVQLALLNLVDYPVVLRVPAEEARAAHVVDRLGQPIELLANTYVITPDTFPRWPSESAKRAIQLADRSVMVFDRDRINRQRLPSTLPRPIESEIAFGAQAGLMGNPIGQSPELRNLGQQATASTELSDFDEQFRRRSLSDSDQLQAPESAQPVHENASESSHSRSTMKPRIANLPFKGVPRVTSSSSMGTRSDNVASDLIPPPDDSTNDDSTPGIAEASSLDESVAKPAPAFTLLQTIILFVTMASLIGAALALRRFLESSPVDLTSIQQSIPEEPIAVPHDLAAQSHQGLQPLLEHLIKNELPVVIEQVQIPGGLVLQGQLASRPILRVDGPQSILKQNRPHFGSTERHAHDSILKETLAHVDSAELHEIRRPHFMNTAQQVGHPNASAPADVSIAEQVSHDESSKAPLAKALFQLEQGGRS